MRSTKAVLSFPLPESLDSVTPMIVADLLASRLFNGRSTHQVTLNREDVVQLLAGAAQMALDNQ